MNVLFLSGHCCIRCVKEGLAMLDAGHSVVFLHQRVANPDMAAVIPLQSFYQSEAQLRQKLTVFSDMDLIHVHNEPTNIVSIAKEMRPDLPVVFDVHDLNSVRGRNPDAEEIKAMAACDGVIFPSKGYRDYCLNELQYVFEGLSEKPSDVIYSLCTKQMLEIPQAARVPGIIYEGRVRTNGTNKDYLWVAKDLAKKNIPFFVMPTSMESAVVYSQAGACVLPTLPYIEMMRQLSRFDWGLVGPAMRCRDGDRGMPNKLFEYLAAGIPVIVHQSEEAAQFVAENNLGVVIENLDEIPAFYDRHEKYRKIVAEFRSALTMETQQPKIVDLYHRAMAYAKDVGGQMSDVGGRMSEGGSCES